MKKALLVLAAILTTVGMAQADGVSINDRGEAPCAWSYYTTGLLDGTCHYWEVFGKYCWNNMADPGNETVEVFQENSVGNTYRSCSQLNFVVQVGTMGTLLDETLMFDPNSTEFKVINTQTIYLQG